MSEYQHQATCPHCSGEINYNDEHAGHATPCPHCGKSVTLNAGSGSVWGFIIGVFLILGVIVRITGLPGGGRSKDTHTKQPAKEAPTPAEFRKPSFPPPTPPKPATSQTPSDEPAKSGQNRVAAMAKLANDYNRSIGAINQLYPAINELERQLRTQRRNFLTEENIVILEFEIRKANTTLSSEIKRARAYATALDELNCKTIPNQPSTPPFQFIKKVE